VEKSRILSGLGIVTLVLALAGCEDSGSKWPIYLPDCEYSSIVFSDLEGNGSKEVVVAGGNCQSSSSGQIEAYDARSGNRRWVFSIPGLRSYPKIAVGDVNGDETLEIIFPFASGSPFGFPDNRLYVLNAHGFLAPGRWPITSSQAYFADGMPATTLSDVNQDGINDVLVHREDIVRGYNNPFEEVYLGEGNLFSRRELDDVNTHGRSAADFDVDGAIESAVAVEGNFGGAILLVNHNSAEVRQLTRWVPRIIGGGILEKSETPFQVVSGNVDGKDNLEIVATTTREQSIEKHPYLLQEGLLYVFDLDGNKLSGWPQVLPERFLDPVLANMDKDEDLEILVSDYYDQVHAWHHDGTQVAGWPVTLPAPLSIGNLQPPVVGDLDGDGVAEVLIALDNCKLMGWHANGAPISGYPRSVLESNGNCMIHEIAIGNFGNDMQVAIGIAGTIVDHTGKTGYVNLLTAPGPYDPSAMEWPARQGNSRRTGRYNNPPSFSGGIPTFVQGGVEKPLRFLACASDPDGGDFLKFSIENPLNNMQLLDTVDPFCRQFYWVPKTSGTHSVRLRVEDPDEKVDTHRLNFCIGGPEESRCP